MSALCQLNEVIDFAANVYDHKTRSHHVIKNLPKAHVIEIKLFLTDRGCSVWQVTYSTY